MQTLSAADCYRCRIHLDEADFRSGTALRIGSLASCLGCAAPLLDRLTREQRRAVLRQTPFQATDNPAPTPRSLRRAATAARPASFRGRPQPAARRLPLIAASAAAIPILAAVAILSSRADRRTGAPPPPPAATPAAPRPAAVPSVPPFRPSAPERADLVAAIADLEQATRGLAGRGAYQASLAGLESARSRTDGFEWSQAVERLEREVRDAVNGLYVRLQPAVQDAQRRGDAEAVQRARAEVAAWGVRQYIDDLEKTLGDPAEQFRTGLVAWWPLDDAAGPPVADASGGGRRGLRSGGVSACAGRRGGALDFDGSSGVVRAPAPPLAGPLTVAAWVRPAGLSGDRAVLGEHNRYALKIAGTSLRFTTPGIRDHDFPAGMASGVWQHVAVTFQPGTPGGAVFYKDGRLLGTRDASALRAGSAPFLIGQNQWGTSQAFRGSIDDVRVYNRILPPAEIRALVEATPTPP